MNWEYAGSTYNDSFILNGIDILKKIGLTQVRWLE